MDIKMFKLFRSDNMYGKQEDDLESSASNNSNKSNKVKKSHSSKNKSSSK
jgi:hypothetical protein